VDGTVLRLVGVTKYFAGVHAVENVDLVVGAGERRAILGPNGAGKTTLFNVIAGAMPATSGRVELFGRDVTDLPAWSRTRMGLARTFQTSRVLAGLSVEDNLYLAALGPRAGRLRVLRTPADRALRGRAAAAAEAVGLADRLGIAAGQLSHGEKRQLEIAMALAAEPRLVLLDEPAAGLARAERQRLTELLLGIDRAVTLIIIEHDMEVALRVAERVTIMDRGRILTEGSPDEIRADQRVHDIYLGRGHGA
jgi:branched-chain amino acid transport system ATP-binding protein